MVAQGQNLELVLGQQLKAVRLSGPTRRARAYSFTVFFRWGVIFPYILLNCLRRLGFCMRWFARETVHLDDAFFLSFESAASLLGDIEQHEVSCFVQARHVCCCNENIVSRISKIITNALH